MKTKSIKKGALNKSLKLIEELNLHELSDEEALRWCGGNVIASSLLAVGIVGLTVVSILCKYKFGKPKLKPGVSVIVRKTFTDDFGQEWEMVDVDDDHPKHVKV